MTTTVAKIMATDLYRHAWAIAAASGAACPRASHFALGTGTAPASPTDTALGHEVYRQPLSTAQADGTVLRITAHVIGSDVGKYPMTECGVYATTADGDVLLMGRVPFDGVITPNALIGIQFECEFTF